MPESKLEALRDRWSTELGRQVREKLLESFRNREDDWGKHLAGFPFSDELDPNEDLRGIDLSELDLTGMIAPYGNLEDANLEGCVFRAPVELQCARLHRARCRRFVTVRRAQMSPIFGDDVDFREADLSEAYLMASTLRRANFANARLVKTAFSYSKLEDSTFENADLTEVDLYGCKLARCNFRNAKLRDADLRNSDLSGVDLRESDLTGANLEDAILIDTLLPKR